MISYDQSIKYLESFMNYERVLDKTTRACFSLDRIKKLLEYLEVSGDSFCVIHVAGSKGKGSVCALTASILKQAGYRVGLYTSPHIYDVRERIRVLDEDNDEASREAFDIFTDMITQKDFCDVLDEIKPAIKKLQTREEMGHLTFFEVFTALALYYFQKQQVDCVVLETGLGGRLDATNAIDTDICAITSISLEHVHILGDTLESIAQEKAAIIKSSKQSVVVASQEKCVTNAIKKRCAQFNIHPILIEEQNQYGVIDERREGQTFFLKTIHARYDKLTLPLLGKHQVGNAAVAIGIVECLGGRGWSVSDEAIDEGLKGVFWPGRFEVTSKNPTIILDGAHNGASAKALMQTVKKLFPDKKIILILGFLKDKDKAAICKELEVGVREIIFVRVDHPRADDSYETVSLKEAIDRVKQEAGKDDVVLITGSLFVVAEARKILFA